MITGYLPSMATTPAIKTLFVLVAYSNAALKNWKLWQKFTTNFEESYLSKERLPVKEHLNNEEFNNEAKIWQDFQILWTPGWTFDVLVHN